MKAQVISDPARVWAFCRSYQSAPMDFIPSMKGLGLERDGELIAGVVYEGFSHTNIWMHVAAAPGRQWLNREFLRVAFDFPFNQLGCKRVSGWVEETNTDARRFDEHLGFKEEARLKGAARDGSDVILYVMWREDCRYV